MKYILVQWPKSQLLMEHDRFEVVLREGKYYVEMIKLPYPKTYEECCEVIDYKLLGTTIIGYKAGVLRTFQKLLVCLDAYWKIAGEEMGLGKPWEPTNETVYCISRSDNVIKSSYRGGKSNILEFPTEKIRDTFYENFNDLINECKELL